MFWIASTRLMLGLIQSIHFIFDYFFKIQKIKKSEAPWRANIFFQREKYRNIILKGLLKKKIKISSWYPSLDLFFQRRKTNLTRFPMSDKLGNKILNIWVNHEVNKSYLNKIYNYLKFYKNSLSIGT